MRVFLSFAAASVICASNLAFGYSSALLELKTGEKTYQGKLVAHDDKRCWLIDRDGQLNEVKLKGVKQHRTIAPRFRGFRSAEMRDRLLREFGPEYEVVGTGHYLVCAKRGEARRFAQTFEDIYRGFYSFFSRRRFEIAEPEFPLVAVVFPDRPRFIEYCRKDSVKSFSGLMGYYLRTTNRVALFDTGQKSLSARFGIDGTEPAPLGPASVFQTNAFDHNLALFSNARDRSSAQVRWHGRTGGGVEGTIVHETTHQVAFNMGLHSRIGENPTWVVEGLATVFEAEGIRSGASRAPAISRINPERFVHFGNYVQSRRKPKSLAEFVSSDAIFRTATLDAYSQAWALTFFLIETRPSQYSAYLKQMAERDPLKPYSAKARLSGFRRAFGDDVEWLEVQFLRFVADLN